MQDKDGQRKKRAAADHDILPVRRNDDPHRLWWMEREKGSRAFSDDGTNRFVSDLSAEEFVVQPWSGHYVSRTSRVAVLGGRWLVTGESLISASGGAIGEQQPTLRILGFDNHSPDAGQQLLHEDRGGREQLFA
jgi:hypothetical protein